MSLSQNPSPDNIPCPTEQDCHEMPKRLPSWLRRPLPTGGGFAKTRKLVDGLSLPTVCSGAKCPNIHECFTCGTATFMILGDSCTRNCRFCNVEPGNPGPPEIDEPDRVAKAAAELNLQHVVVTSVTRDDLKDGGSAHFAATIKAIHKALPQSSIEVLIPDFKGCEKALQTVAEAKPDIINHNVETHPSLYSEVRPQAIYTQSLELLKRVHAMGIVAKSGFMVGIGENDDQVKELLSDLKNAGCSMVTIGQYMRPSKAHREVYRYVHPDKFDEYAKWGRDMGIPYVFSAPLVRSSYQAKESLAALRK